MVINLQNRDRKASELDIFGTSEAFPLWSLLVVTNSTYYCFICEIKS